MSDLLPRIVADTPLDATIEGLLRGRVEVVSLDSVRSGGTGPVDAEGIYTYGHPTIDAAVMDRLPGLKVISNYGVGVDHINLADAAARGIAVGNTPGVLEATTADLGFALLLASARRIVEGDRYAHSPEFVRYDPGYMLGREVHDKTLGIIGMGQIGRRVARRAVGFDMTVLYHNRRRREDVEAAMAGAVKYAGLDELLAQSDYVMLCVPLTDQTRGLIGEGALSRMKRSATLINIARGAVVDTEALAHAPVRRPDRRRGARRHRARAAPSRSSAAVHAPGDHHPAPRQRDRGDPPPHGRALGREPHGGPPRRAAAASGRAACGNRLTLNDAPPRTD